jgi:PAS domain S-box-containing protein
MTNGTLVIAASHDPRLVAVSVVISILAAYAARDLARMVSIARGRAALAWLLGAALADGIATWSMHYTGKLALRLPVPMQFDWRMVVLSLLVSVVASAVALRIVGHARPRWGRVLVASVFLGGLGISGLHYTAMAAMRIPGWHHHYASPALQALGVVLAIAFSAMALALRFLFRDESPARLWSNHAGPLLRGAANPVMHYTAMAGVVFVHTGEVADLSHAVSISSLGILGISVVPAMVLVVALLTSLAGRLQKQKALLDELFDQAPQAVALTTVDDRIVRVNREFTRMFGYAPEEAVGQRVSELIVPDELREEARRYADSAARGQRVDVEAVRQRKDGSRLRVAMVRVPVAIPGGQIQTYAIFVDISERRKAEEALRTFPRQLIEAQESERRRMARELHDEIGQLLTGVSLMVTASQKLPADQGGARLAKAQSVLDELIGRVRNLALDLRPAMLDDFGLVPALLWLIERYVEQTGVRVDFKQLGLEGRRFDPAIETAAYRIVQEALTNVARHAEVREATVRVWARSHVLEVEVEDQGKGFDPASTPSSGSVGLAGMRERAIIVNGSLTIETSAGAGTRVAAELPLSENGPGRT